MNNATSPAYWLPKIVPPVGPSPSLGLGFFTSNVATFLVGMGVFLVIVLSLIFLIAGGIMLTVSGGDKEGAVKAKMTITSAMVGLVLGLASVVILAMVGNFFGTKLVGP